MLALAQSELSNACSLDASSAYYPYMLGTFHQIQREWPAAMAAFRRSLQQAGTYRSDVLSRVWRRRGSIRDLEFAIDDTIDGRIGLSRFLSDTGNDAFANAALVRAAELTSDEDTDKREQIARELIRIKAPRTAIRLLHKWLGMQTTEDRPQMTDDRGACGRRTAAQKSEALAGAVRRLRSQTTEVRGQTTAVSLPRGALLQRGGQMTETETRTSNIQHPTFNLQQQAPLALALADAYDAIGAPSAAISLLEDVCTSLDRSGHRTSAGARAASEGSQQSANTEHQAQLLCALAKRYASSGDLDRAIATIDAWRQTRGAGGPCSQKDLDLLVLLASFHARAGRHDDAAKLYERLVRRAPTISHRDRWSRQLSDCYFRLNRISDALKFYRGLVYRAPGNASSHYELGRALARAGNRIAALRHYDRALALAPANAHFKRTLGEATAELARMRQLTLVDPGAETPSTNTDH